MLRPLSRLLLVQILEMLAMLEEGESRDPTAIRRASRLLAEGHDEAAVEALRSAAEPGIASLAWLIEQQLYRDG